MFCRNVLDDDPLAPPWADDSEREADVMGGDVVQFSAVYVEVKESTG